MGSASRERHSTAPGTGILPVLIALALLQKGRAEEPLSDLRMAVAGRVALDVDAEYASDTARPRLWVGTRQG